MEENTINTVENSEPNKKSNLLIPIVGIFLVVALIAAFLSKSGNKNLSNGGQNRMVAGDSTEVQNTNEELSESSDEEASENKTGSMTTSPTGTNSMVSESGIINVEGGMFYFKPNEIKVKKGEPVKIVFSNVEGIHDFVIDELNVQSKKVKAGETDTIEFTPTKTGSFEFYCSVGTHRQMGMKGTLLVE